MTEKVLQLLSQVISNWNVIRYCNLFLPEFRHYQYYFLFSLKITLTQCLLGYEECAVIIQDVFLLSVCRVPMPKAG